MTRETRIERAAEHLGARRLGEDRYAYRDDATRLWYVLSADELAELCDYLDHADLDIRRDAYSHWCAGSSAQEGMEYEIDADPRDYAASRSEEAQR